jgi:hypothetical protein
MISHLNRTLENKEVAADASPWERQLQQDESAAMHERSRAPATALWRGISDSAPASAFTADLRGSSRTKNLSEQLRERPSLVEARQEDLSILERPAEARGGDRRPRRREWVRDAGSRTERRRPGRGGGGGGAAERRHRGRLLRWRTARKITL